MAFTHVVELGECMSSLAKRFGFRDYRTIYDDPSNAALKAKRPVPGILFPGDSVVIPDKQARVEARPTGKRHEFFTRVSRTFLRLKIDTARPLAFELVVDGGAPQVGTTDGTDVLVHEIAADAHAAQITFWPATLPVKTAANGSTMTLALGGLEPIEEIAGVKGRLQNLGFHHGPIDGQLDDRTVQAIKDFESFLGKPPTGQLSDTLRAELVSHHDL